MLRVARAFLSLAVSLSVATAGAATAGTPFCPGDGSGAACPCGNVDPSGVGGCLHSASPALGPGAVLNSVGVELPNAFDTVVLTAANLPLTTTVLFVQGTATVAGGAGSAFGDGLLCAGGTLIRLRAKFTTTGTVSFPAPGEPQLHLVGQVPGTGGTRYYQAWYRNPPVFCTGATFNLSNGWQINW